MSEKKKVEVVVGYDEMAEDPTSWDGWKVYSFSRRHGSFKDPSDFGLYVSVDKDSGAKTLVSEDDSLKKKLDEGWAFLLSYFEHGGCIWSLEGERAPGTQGDWRWDGVDIAGLLIWEQDSTEARLPEEWDFKKREESARAFIADYTAYCNGYVCYWSVLLLKECPTCKHVDKELVESCGGYLQSDYCEPGESYDPMAHLKDDLKTATKDYEVVSITGEASNGLTVEDIT